MDETTQSRTSDAAATRKRRSSILKSQRPARTPFSELEFHVATPTDTTKSRRVSFSRRTGVAEFATNEATTTWKNFYEEHNKSLESSGNDSGANSSKQHLGHIGKRLFDQQFEEVDAVDFMGSLNPGYNINSSISNINFAQLTSIDCTDDIKLTAPQNNFELSEFTNNHSNIFKNDITVPGMGEQSERININFSAIQKIEEKDDLDEIQRDIKNQGNVICHGPFRDKQNLSEYIEIDLNSTHAMLRNDESDMSITDTIHSPKVQEVSKSVSIENIGKKDWETDKENIAVNPYVTPKESVNFAINEEPDKVLVFDGKRLTIQSETVPSKPILQTITPDQIEPPKAAQRKTIVLNVNDDLPNFIDDSNAAGYLSVADLKKHIELDSSMSITNPIVKNDQTQRQKTVPYDDLGDISLTQGVPSNIVQEKRRTIVFEDGSSNISVTQAVPTNIIDKTEKRRTILFENDTGNISITQSLPTHVILNERRNTVIYDNKDCNISMTQALPANIITENVPNKMKTIVYEDGTCNLSITQAVPNIVISVKSPEKACTSEDGSGNMSVTQAIPSNIIIEENLKERRRTVVYESDTGNISVTEAVPANLIYTHNPNTNNIPRVGIKPTNILSDNEINRRKTVGFGENAGNLSITEAVSSNVISNLKPQGNKRKTIVFNDEDADISMTQAVPMNKLISYTKDEENKVSNNTDKRNTIVFNNEEADMSVTQAIDQIISEFEKTVSKDKPKTECTDKRRTIVSSDENASNNMSMTQSVDVKPIIPEAIPIGTNGVQNTICDENADVSMPEAVLPTQDQEKCKNFENDGFLAHEEPTHYVAPNKSNINEILDISIGEDVKKKIQDSVMFREFDKTTNVRSANENEIDIPVEDTSLSKPIPHNLSQIQDDILDKSLKKYYKAAKNEVLDHTANVSQVLVYQMSQSAQSVQKGIEKQNSKTEPPMIVLSDDGEAPINLKIEDLIQNKEAIIEKVSSAIKVNDNVVDLTIDDKNDTSIKKVEIESKPFLSSTKVDDNIEKRNSYSVITVTKIDSEKNLKANVPDVQMSDTPSKSEVKGKKSVLHDLLDMSESSLEERTSDQTKMESNIEQKDSEASVNKECIKEKSNDTLFYITKDDEEAISKEIPQIEQVSPLPLEYKGESTVDELQNKLNLLKTVFGGEIHQKNKETDRKSTTQEDTKSYTKEQSISKNISKCSKSFKLANDTNELLDMLSDLTDKRTFRMLDPHLEEDDEKPEPVTIRGRLALENKSGMPTEPRRISFAPERRSVILSHEDIYNNISMAGAALQKSRLERDEFDDNMDETTKESPDLHTSTKNNVRLSKEIVKTLQFDEDSVSEASGSNLQVSPLKKTAFGETSYMMDNKANVIPSYVTDVSDGLKELMDDLVKPAADSVPFDSLGTILKNKGSTCSMQIQANLVTSSQIDINTELYSNSDSVDDWPRTSSAEIIKDAVRRSISHSLKSPLKSVTITTPSSEKFMDAPSSAQGVTSPGVVIVFDHNNPLNNIILPPLERGDVHKYNPIKSAEVNSAIRTSKQNDSDPISSHQSSEVVSTQMNVENVTIYPKQSNEMKTESMVSNVSKPTSIDRSENTKNDLKDSEVNTVIAMKGNKELLEASSSLTLVDDNIHISCEPEIKHSPVKLLYKVDEGELPEKDSDFTSNEDLIQFQTKAKKRIYSPAKDKHKYCTLSSLDVTPKPLSKMQKISESSFKQEKTDSPTKIKADKDETRKEIKRTPSPTKRISFSTKRIEPKRSSSPKIQHKRKEILKKSGTNVTVQQVMTEIKLNTDHTEQQINEATNIEISSSEPKSVSVSNSDMQSIDMVSSFTSSKNLGRDDRSIVTSSGEHRLSDDCSRMDWQDNDEYTKKYVADCDSSVNIVARIDMLPFMGSHECEWESSIGDTWSFRLLHSCLRLTVRLQHRHENATRTCVRADTPVLHAQIETLHTEKKNPIAVLCVRFACEAMRYELSQGCSKAGQVPALVRRCAAIARLATRWARTMHDARARLAYCLTQDGILALKVANIPLRSVWEVRLKLDLVVSEAGGAPFPRATPLAAVRVVAERHVPVKELRHVVQQVPHDWGHAPLAIWRIFKYLKNKRREDEFLELNY